MKNICIALLLVLATLVNLSAQVLVSTVANNVSTSYNTYQAAQDNIEDPDKQYIEFVKGFCDAAGITMLYHVSQEPKDILPVIYSLAQSLDPRIYRQAINNAEFIENLYKLYKEQDREYIVGMIIFMAISHRAMRWDAINTVKTVRLSYLELELDNAYLKIALPKKFYKDIMRKHGHTEFAIQKGKSIFLVDRDEYISMVLLGSDWRKLIFNPKHKRFQTIGINEFTERKYKLIFENVVKTKKKINGKPVYTVKAYNMFPLLPKTK